MPARSAISRWVQRQTNIRAVLARTAVLMVPSIYFEAAGRVIAEAMLAGIPVLATRNGSIPEQLNGGGVV
ncbi:MAG: glycosyltransferase [Thalassovita sp.]